MLDDREHVESIEEAKRPETRARRIAAVANAVRGA
jgi:Bacteriocin-protection, YdeI or OmpD-Associated